MSSVELRGKALLKPHILLDNRYRSIVADTLLWVPLQNIHHILCISLYM